MEHKQATCNPLTKKRHPKNCAKVTKFSDFTKGVFRISKNIRNVNGFALQQDAPNYTTTSRGKRLGLQVFFVLRRVPIVCGAVVARISRSAGGFDPYRPRISGPPIPKGC
jgi:hypothetical protein